MRNGVVQLAKMEELTMHKRLSEFGLLKSCFEMKNPRPSCARNVLVLDNDPFLGNDPRLLDYNELQKKHTSGYKVITRWIGRYNYSLFLSIIKLISTIKHHPLFQQGFHPTPLPASHKISPMPASQIIKT